MVKDAIQEFIDDIPDMDSQEACRELQAQGYDIQPEELEAIMELVNLDELEIH